MKRSVTLLRLPTNRPCCECAVLLFPPQLRNISRNQNKMCCLQWIRSPALQWHSVKSTLGRRASRPKGYPPPSSLCFPPCWNAPVPTKEGSITGFYTVLVEGDDVNDPIADAIAPSIDGHIILSRDLAAKGTYPAVDVLTSASRVMVMGL